MKKKIINFLLKMDFEKVDEESESYANDLFNVVFQNREVALAQNIGFVGYFSYKKLLENIKDLGVLLA